MSSTACAWTNVRPAVASGSTRASSRRWLDARRRGGSAASSALARPPTSRRADSPLRRASRRKKEGADPMIRPLVASESKPTSVGDVRQRAQREVVLGVLLLDELRAVAAAQGGAIRLVVHPDHHVGRDGGEAPVVALRPVIGAERVVEVLPGAVVHELPVDA